MFVFHSSGGLLFQTYARYIFGGIDGSIKMTKDDIKIKKTVILRDFYVFNIYF